MIFSDNGTQMVGAEKELRKMIEGWNTENLREYFANTDMAWKFITPAAPHQNECTEALVKSCKIALKRAIRNHNLTPLELYTCLYIRGRESSQSTSDRSSPKRSR